MNETTRKKKRQIIFIVTGFKNFLENITSYLILGARKTEGL